MTGLRYSRSLGQRMFGIAVLAEDGSAMTSKMWDQRARRKLIFLIPILNIIQGIRELARISQRHTHQSNIDLHVESIVAHADSCLPQIGNTSSEEGQSLAVDSKIITPKAQSIVASGGCVVYPTSTQPALGAYQQTRLGWFVCNQK